MERLLGPRFLIAVLLPVLLTAGASLLVGLAATGQTLDDFLRAWQDYSTSGQLMAGLWIALGLVGATYVLAFFQIPLLRILEGYWPQRGVLGRLRRLRTDRHRRMAAAGWDQVRALRDKTEHTDSSALAERLLTAYPPPPRLARGCLPTALGNRLRAAEYYPLERYGIDSVVIWPRLRPLLPSEACARLTAARTALDGTVTLLGLSTAFGVIWPVALLITGERTALAALCLLAWPVAWAAHTATQRAAVAFGQEVRVAFDLHRHLLPRHLGLNVPPNADAERLLWDDLTQFYLRNAPLGRSSVPSNTAG